MRLIDADAFIEDLKKQMETATNPFFAMSCDFCIFRLEEQPTAYSVEAVVAELEKYAKSKICDKHKHGCPYKDNEDIYCENCGALGAISIVRGKE